MTENQSASSPVSPKSVANSSSAANTPIKEKTKNTNNKLLLSATSTTTTSVATSGVSDDYKNESKSKIDKLEIKTYLPVKDEALLKIHSLPLQDVHQHQQPGLESLNHEFNFKLNNLQTNVRKLLKNKFKNKKINNFFPIK